MSKQSPLASTASPLLLSKLAGRPGTGSLHSTIPRVLGNVRHKTQCNYGKGVHFLIHSHTKTQDSLNTAIY